MSGTYSEILMFNLGDYVFCQDAKTLKFNRVGIIEAIEYNGHKGLKIEKIEVRLTGNGRLRKVRENQIIKR